MKKAFSYTNPYQVTEIIDRKALKYIMDIANVNS